MFMKMFMTLTNRCKKLIRLVKDELGGQIMTEFVGLRPKTYSYLTFCGGGDKETKGTKKCIIKLGLKFEGFKRCLLSIKIMLRNFIKW